MKVRKCCNVTSHWCHITLCLKVPKEATDYISHVNGEIFSGIISKQIFKCIWGENKMEEKKRHSSKFRVSLNIVLMFSLTNEIYRGC